MSDDLKNNSPAPENESPGEHSTVPMWIFGLLLILFFAGAIYFDDHSGWFNPQIYAPYQSAEELENYQPKSGAAEMLAQGKKSYDLICAACHGPNGEGKPGQAPPLAGSEWVNAKGFKRIVEIPQLGLNGPVTVKGQNLDFPSGMPPMGAQLSDADLAAVLTYIRASWGNKAEAVTADDVKSVRTAVAGHSAINGEQGLDAIKE
ncbi:MAG TPA: cytochrome c [Verrucomicrobiae bacterium]|nr:cytochrome c [Verrucomicrobiae bacterium]